MQCAGHIEVVGDYNINHVVVCLQLPKVFTRWFLEDPDKKAWLLDLYIYSHVAISRTSRRQWQPDIDENGSVIVGTTDLFFS